MQLLGDDGDHAGAAHAVKPGGVRTARRANGILDDGHAEALVEQAERRLRHADVGLESHEHGGAPPRVAHGGANERIAAEAEDLLAQHRSVADRLDELGMQTAPIVRRLHRRDDRDVAETRALRQERDALEQAGFGFVLDAGQKVGLHVDDHEDGVVGIDQIAHVRKASERRRVLPWR